MGERGGRREGGGEREGEGERGGEGEGEREEGEGRCIGQSLSLQTLTMSMPTRRLSVTAMSICFC